MIGGMYGLISIKPRNLGLYGVFVFLPFAVKAGRVRVTACRGALPPWACRPALRRPAVLPNKKSGAKRPAVLVFIEALQPLVPPHVSAPYMPPPLPLVFPCPVPLFSPPPLVPPPY